MMQPIAISAAVPMPYSSAPIIAAMTISRPVRKPPSVRKRDPVAQLVHRQNLMRLGQAHFPWQTGEFDDWSPETPRCHHYGPKSGSHPPWPWPPRQQWSRPRLAATSLTVTLAARVDLFEVIDQLCQILDRIDIVVRRRGDQRHAGVEWRKPAINSVTFMPGKLSALTGLGPLGDLDLQLFALVQIFRRHAKAADGDLLDLRRRIVAVGLGVKCAGSSPPSPESDFGADPVHCDVQRLMRLGLRAPSDIPG